MKRTVLIAGGAGFIGSHLCDFFLNKGFFVIAIDNLITGNINNLSNCFKNVDFQFIKHDILFPLNINRELNYILNFASPASPKYFKKFALETLFSGSIGTKNLIDLALKKKSKILVASTSEIYGDPLVHPQKENYFGNVNTIGPRSVYDESKRYQETMIYSYHKNKNLDISIARIFNTYGPRMDKDDGRVIPSFINNAIKSNDLTIYGNGNQTRSFCYIDDMVEGIYKLLLSKISKPLNLGNPDEISINKLANEIISFCDNKVNKKFQPLTENDPKKRKPDISQAITKLDWIPKTSRKVGIKKTFEYFRSIIKN